MRKALSQFSFSLSSRQFIELEEKYGCHNYQPVPVVIARAKGLYVWDQEGKRYMDLLAGHSAVNQGHCHEKIVQVFRDQASNLTLTSRAFYNNKLGEAEKFMSNLFKYDKVLFMNSGAEAGESAIKLARRWAYNVKRISDNNAWVLFAQGNFWGRSIAGCASSNDPLRYKGFGPFGGLNFDLVEYNNLEALEEKFRSNPNIAAFMLEPVQGENGIIIPHLGYLKRVRDLCSKYNVLMIADEVQAGLGRTGYLLACQHEDVRPDIVLLGKSLSGGLYPISAILADDQIMLQIKPGEHGSTYGGNPVAAALAIKSLEVLLEEGMIENSAKMGLRMNQHLEKLRGNKLVKDVRCRGLMGAIEFKKQERDIAWDLSLKFAEKGLLCKGSHGTIIRFTPPLVLNQEEVDQAFNTINQILNNF